MIPASKYFSSDEAASLDLTDDEKKMAEEIRVFQVYVPQKCIAVYIRVIMSFVCCFILVQGIWKGVLSNVAVIDDTTDFFKSGAASMDVVRWV